MNEVLWCNALPEFEYSDLINVAVHRGEPSRHINDLGSTRFQLPSPAHMLIDLKASIICLEKSQESSRVANKLKDEQFKVHLLIGI